MPTQPTQKNPYVCLTIIIILGAFGLLSLGGIIACALLNKDVPSALIAIASGCGGNLASFLVSVPRGSVGAESGAPAVEGPR